MTIKSNFNFAGKSPAKSSSKKIVESVSEALGSEARIVVDSFIENEGNQQEYDQ